MASPASQIIDFTQEDSITHPFPAVVSSRGSHWDRLHLGLYPMPPHATPEHWSPHHILSINYGSRLDLKLAIDDQSKTIDLLPGAIGIYPAYLSQRFEWFEATTFLDLYLEPSLLTQIGIELGDKDCVELIPDLGFCTDQLIHQIAIALKTALEVNQATNRLYIDAMGNALAAHLLARYSTQQPTIKKYAGGLTGQQLKCVTDYIHTYLDQDLSLAELANLIQLSPFHFARLFKQTTGVAPHRYHLQCRINRAKQLLLERELSLAEIACVVGFSGQAHLNYHFKRLVGMTPKAFVRQQ